MSFLDFLTSRQAANAGHGPRRPLSRPVCVGAVTTVLLVLGLLLASNAFAAYERVGIFSGSLIPPVEPGVFPEEVQLGGVGGLAVNVSGAGGVAPGTVYAAMGSLVGGTHVARFEPEPDGKLSFVEAWKVTSAGEPKPCGPILHTSCQPWPSESEASDVDVDQTTGDVYVYNATAGPGVLAVNVYSPDGAKVISRFGEVANQGELTASSAEKIHDSAYAGGIAVNGSGDVYVFDFDPYNPLDKLYHRLMKFEPQSPGDYEHYVYAGKGQDVAAGFFGEGKEPTRPVLDAAGHIYVAGEETIEEYSPGQSSGPICVFVEHRGGIVGITVNPDTGEVFYYDSKNRALHRLSACNREGQFVEVESIAVKPERGDVSALTFDPSRRFAPSRTPGVLYAATPEAIPTNGGKGEPGQSALGYILAPVEEDPPTVVSEHVSGVTGTSAELHAEIDPKGSETHYVFQYLTEQAFSESGEESFAAAAESPLGGTTLGNGQVALGAAVTLSGLAPETEYRYRVVATSRCLPSEPEKVCESPGSAQSFRTSPLEAPGLPDHRAYELVSPPEKFGGQVFPADSAVMSCFPECKPGVLNDHFPMQASPDGEGIVYEGTAFSSAGGAVIENEYRAGRTATGWQTTNLTPALLESHGDRGYKAFDPNLSRGLLEQVRPSLAPSAPSEYANIYAQPTGTPSTLDPLLTESPPDRLPGTGFNSFTMSYAGASSDLSRVFFEANDALTGQTPLAPAAVDGGESKRNLYEATEAGLRLVNVMPGNAATTPGGGFGADNEKLPLRNDLSHAISSDGSRAFWSSEAGQVYVREGAERTVEIPDHAGRFLTAAADGSEVLLTDGHIYGHLDGELPTQEADLTAGHGGFRGSVGQSEDLSSVYFVDTAVLDEQPNARGAVAREGQDNLYVWHEGASVFIATLASTDGGEIAGGDFAAPADWRPSPSQRTAEASPDGRWVAFLSTARLTGYDNTGPCEAVAGTGKFLDAPCGEAFLYDSATRELRCASCNPSGATPLGRSVLRLIFPPSAGQPQARYLTDSGRLYFDSEDSLTPADTNHGVEDVYEFQPDGVGTCGRSEGCVSLISAGTGEVDSNLIGIDESGKNVFFTTRDRLVPADKDQLIDLYDAREGGGFASESEPSPKGCLGETCQGPPSAPLIEPEPGSFTFSGAGNLNVSSAPGTTTAKPKALTRAQLLARALKACKKKPKNKRAKCESTARRKYGVHATAKRTTRQRGGVRR